MLAECRRALKRPPVLEVVASCSTYTSGPTLSPLGLHYSWILAPAVGKIDEHEVVVVMRIVVILNVNAII